MKISRVLLLLVTLAGFKLVLLGVVGLDSLTETVGTDMIPVAAVAEAQEADKAEPETAPEAQPEASPEAMEETVLPESRPAGMDESDWQVLKRREEELAAKQRSLTALEASLDAKIEEMEALQVRLNALLDEARNVKDERLQKLIKAYGNMKAKSAAAVLETMDSGLAVKILAGLQGRQAGEILGFIEPRKAAQLSEALTEINAPFE